MTESKINKLENQIQVLTDLIADNKKLKKEVAQLKHLRRLDLEFLGILVWGYGIDRDKYNAMDKRIYSGFSTYKQRTYDWDWLSEFVASERDLDPLFDRIELINNEVKEQRKKDLELYQMFDKTELTITPEIVEKAKKGELNETE